MTACFGVVILLSVAALPGIFEELSFRGVLQPLLIRATGSAFWGIALTAIVFSAIHFQFYGFLPRVLLGALFGWLAHRTRQPHSRHGRPLRQQRPRCGHLVGDRQHDGRHFGIDAGGA